MDRSRETLERAGDGLTGSSSSNAEYTDGIPGPPKRASDDKEISKLESPCDICRKIKSESLQDASGKIKLESPQDISGGIKSEPELTASAETSIAEESLSDDDHQCFAVTTEVIPEGMSPHQWKVALRRQRKTLRREEALLRRKEKFKKRREEKKLERKQKIAEKRPNQSPSVFRPKRRRMEESSCGIRVAIDLSYSSLMSEKDNKKVMMQCQRSYAVNRRAENPLQFYLTSFGEEVETLWDVQYDSYKNWDVHRHREGFVELFGKENVVFLTSDSANVLTDLTPDKVYIIGGLVDHNHRKGYCYQQALELGVAHAQLPITQFVQLNSRTVLTINHVFEILLEYCTNKDWEKAFCTIIPPRKIAGKVDSENKETKPDDSEDTRTNDSS